MQQITKADFPAFFAELNNGNNPYDWQLQLLEYVLAHRKWPDRIDAPTGAGKSCVVEIHLFVNAMETVQPRRLPRRLVHIVGRRALVDSMEQKARGIAAKLSEATPESILGRVRAGLRDNCGSIAEDAEPVAVSSLRGGVPPTSVWRDDPLVCQVICATPDMWGSRALFRGYSTRDRARPREAATLTYDAVAILDEAHLNRQLATTARQIADLMARERVAEWIPALQVVEMTATQATHRRDSQDAREATVGYDWAAPSTPDAAAARLDALLSAPKPVSLLALNDWPLPSTGSKRKTGLARIVDAVAAQRQQVAGTVGCIVNHVDTALDVAEQLRSKGLRVVTLVGRMRPAELAELHEKHPDLFTVRGDAGVDVLVATQAIEVGVDIDLHALVTELAPASSLAQRVGRVNRRGLRDEGPITVVVPEKPECLAPVRAGKKGRVFAPYTADELAASLTWLHGIRQTPSGLSPRTINASPMPPHALRRLVLSRVTQADIELFANTSMVLFAEPDLTFWLRDELEEPPTVSIVARALPTAAPEDIRRGGGITPGGVTEARDLEVIQAAPPAAHELYPCTMSSAGTFLAQFGSIETWRVYRWSATDGTAQRLERGSIRPGDVLIVNAGEHEGVSDGVIARDGLEQTSDVLGIDLDTDEQRRLLYRNHADHPEQHEHSWHRELFETLDQLAATTPTISLDELEAVLDAELVSQILTDLKVDRERSSVLVTVPAILEGEESVPWCLISALRSRASLDEYREVWTDAKQQVLLRTHEDAVAERAERVAQQLGLPSGVVSSLERAGALHDEGKRDVRFQEVLRGRAVAFGHEPLAKSARASLRARTPHATSGLPLGWRHEQLSAAYAWARFATWENQDGRDLVTRLIGTSHGVGRGMFPHSSRELLMGSEDERTRAAAVELFDVGEWDALLARTEHRWGVWGCAYLEAILRAADARVSKEGS